MKPVLRVSGLCKAFEPGSPVVDQLSLEMFAGQITCLLGPSGCGKTTTLRLIAGFETPDAGEIHQGERLLSRPGYVLPSEKRQMGMVFQEYALFPHLSVEANLAFGLSGWSRAERRQRVNELCSLLDIGELCRRYPHQLSGGQQQRLALGRALAPRPRLLLLDEPFANLDVALRQELRQEIFGMLRCSRIPVLLVTHDQEEALSVSDRLAVMREGKIEQAGPPDEIYDKPATRFVAGFVGQANWLLGTRSESEILTELGPVTLAQIAVQHCVCDEVQVLLRPDNIAIATTGGVMARVLSLSYHGTRKLCTLQLPSGTSVQASFNGQTPVAPGDNVPLRLAPHQLSIFAGPGEAASHGDCCQAARQVKRQINWFDESQLPTT